MGSFKLYGDENITFYFSAHVRSLHEYQRMPKPEHPDEVANLWESWCGVTSWSKLLREFGELGGLITYYCGVPRSASAIPLTFSLHAPDKTVIEGNSRLKDIKAAIAKLKNSK